MDKEFTCPLVQVLKDKMKKGGVHFTFTKKDGTERKAYGTRWGQMIEEVGGVEALPKDHSMDLTYCEKIGSVAYFDLDKQAWRSFQEGSLVSIDD